MALGRSVLRAGVRIALVSLCGAALFVASEPAHAASAAELDRSANAALKQLRASSHRSAQMLAKEARGVLVFPQIVKGGFLFGGQYGDGVLRVGGRTAGYYRSLAASYGLQAGLQSFGYALFFMNDKALGYFRKSRGFELGVGPSLVVLDAGAAAALTTTTARSDVYAVFFDQKGLMGGIGVQGTKITQIHPK
jgi:lipid-binding SYLF domain-containing protein